MINVVFQEDSRTAHTQSVYQWDYGQKYRIQGLDLPTAVEIHFGEDTSEETITRVGVTKDGATEVVIPDSLLEQYNRITAYIYLTDDTSGRTEYKIVTSINERPKPEPFDKPEDAELFREAIDAVNSAADRAEEAKTEADASAEEAREALQDAREELSGIGGHVDEAKGQIDSYVKEKEHELKGETGDVAFASFKVIPPKLYMFNDKDRTHIEFTREGSKMSYRPHFPEREVI